MAQFWSMLEPAARPVVAILFNGLWQGALVAVAVWAILRAFPRANASTRYAAWSAALIAILVLPVATTVVAAPHAAVRTSHPSSAVRPATPQRATARVSGAALPTVVAPVRSSASLPAAPYSLSAPAGVAIAIFALWTLATLLCLARLIVSLTRLERLKSDALPLAVDYRDAMSSWERAGKGSRGVRICVSEAIDVPVAVGLFDAMILLPRHLLDALDAREIDQISLHELAHLRRGDDWTNGLQRLAQAFLFFNPAVAFVARQMDLEREVACDDWVLSLTGDVRPYAFCLTKMAEVTAWPHRPLAAPGVFVTRKSISIRIERILAARRAIGSALAPGASSAVLAALIAAFFVVRTMTPSIAYTTAPSGDATAKIASVQPDPSPKEPEPKAPPSPRRGSPLPAATERPPAVVPGGPKSAIARKTSAGRAVVASVSATRAVAPVQLAAFVCSGCDLHGVHWAGRDLHGASMEGADFGGADLHGANLSHAQLTGANFRGADLRGTSFAHAAMEGCYLRGAALAGADFSGASMTGCSLDAAKLSPAQAAAVLDACEGCSFRGADLHGRDLRGIHLTGTDLGGADLRGADLSDAVLMGVNLARARLAGAKFDGARLFGCDFDGVDMRNVDLTHADLTGSALPDATR